jgi:hypothetical protein
MAVVVEACKEAYASVRKGEARYAVFTYNSDRTEIVVHQLGSSDADHDTFLKDLPTDAAAWAYYAFPATVDEVDRTKFVLARWIPKGVSPLVKGRTSVDNRALQAVVKDISVEIAASELSEITEKGLYVQHRCNSRSWNY